MRSEDDTGVEHVRVHQRTVFLVHTCFLQESAQKMRNLLALHLSDVTPASIPL